MPSPRGKYVPIKGYAALGGKAEFMFENGRLKTTQLEFGGKTFTAADFSKTSAFAQSKLVDWQFAEKAIIASLLAPASSRALHHPSRRANVIAHVSGVKHHARTILAVT